MAPPLLTLQNIALTFGGAPLFVDAGLLIEEGDRLCLVGRNGAGKSTLMRIAAGLVEADAGERFVKPGVTLRYLEQDPDLSGFARVEDYVRGGLGEGDPDHRIGYLLDHLDVEADADPATLSGGEARRAAIARVMAPEPDILMLDEPTNHLDIAAIEWLERELGSSRSALVLISHDRRFLETLSRRTLWVDRGGTRQLDRGFAHFEAWRDTLFEEEERDRHKLDRKIEREQHWIVHGVSGRRKRNQKRLGDLRTLRQERIRLAARGREAAETVTMASLDARASGKLVIEAENVAKAWGGVPVVSDFSIKIQRGDRIGLVGPNGAGKTTLINLLTGVLAPDSGAVRLGTNLEVASLDQRRAALDADTSLKDALTGGGSDMVMVGDTQRHVMSYMKDFLFRPEQAGTPIGRLSGGERGRLMLARAFTRPSNLLVLDEPTNDLDFETLDLLQELIADYSGTVLLVSHDRDFLDRIVTSVVASEGEGEGRWTVYAGGYSDMLAQRGAARGEAKAAARPKGSGEERRKPQGASRKLSFKDKHALETLPGRMEMLEAEIARLEDRLADPGLYARDPDGFGKATAELTGKQTDLAEAEEEWLRLEMLREELENS